ncbi:SDR family oxidoreductase [soil metagenome]
MARILVTGAARGLGLEFVRQYLERGETVLAAARRPSEAMGELGIRHGTRYVELTLDVDDEASIAQARRSVEEPIDVLINNAGIGHAETRESSENLGTLTQAGIETVLRTNLVGPTLVTQAFLDRLGEGSKVAAVSSAYSWLARRDGHFANNFAYSYSKVGVNMLMRSLGILLKERGVLSVSLDPGWARTDMGGPDAFISAEESVRGMMALLDALGPDDSGGYISWEGERLAY